MGPACVTWVLLEQHLRLEEGAPPSEPLAIQCKLVKGRPRVDGFSREKLRGIAHACLPIARAYQTFPPRVQEEYVSLFENLMGRNHAHRTKDMQQEIFKAFWPFYLKAMEWLQPKEFAKHKKYCRENKSLPVCVGMLD